MHFPTNIKTDRLCHFLGSIFNIKVIFWKKLQGMIVNEIIYQMIYYYTVSPTSWYGADSQL